MSTLAVFAAPTVDTPEALEWLRVIAALVATGDAPRLVEIGQGVGRLALDAVGDETARVLETLASFDVVPEALAPAELVLALAACSRLVRIAAPDRSGQPALLVLDDARISAGRLDPEALSRDVLEAGQAVRGQN